MTQHGCHAWGAVLKEGWVNEKNKRKTTSLHDLVRENRESLLLSVVNTILLQKMIQYIFQVGVAPKRGALLIKGVCNFRKGIVLSKPTVCSVPARRCPRRQ